MSDYVKTKIPGVYVRHENACKAVGEANARCTCGRPSYRARRRDLGWSPTFKSRDQAMEWKSSAAARAARIDDVPAPGPTFGALAREWWAGVQAGSIAKRKGRKADGYSDTTLAGYKRSLFNTLLPAFENEPAVDLDETRWQAWVDTQASAGLSRSRIANHLAVRVRRVRVGIKAHPSHRRVQPDHQC